MTPTHLLRLIDELSTAFRAAVASAPSLDVQLPTCPEWTLFDLVRHVGEGRRKWAAVVAAGPAAAPRTVAKWTFSKLDTFTWWRLAYMLRTRHRWNWGQLRHHLTKATGRWVIAADGARTTASRSV